MKIIKTYPELDSALKVRDEEIVIVDGLAEEIYDKFTSDDPRVYGSLTGAISIPDMLINLVFGSVSIFNTLMLIQKEYNIDFNEDNSQVFLSLKDEFRRK